MSSVIKTTIDKMTLYGWLKCGVVIRLGRKNMRFVSYTYDTVDGHEKMLYVFFDIELGKYVVREESDIKNEKAKIIDQDEKHTKAE